MSGSRVDVTSDGLVSPANEGVRATSLPESEAAPAWQRPPFEPGNDLAVTHGAYSKLRIGVRAGELVDELRDLVTRYRSNDEPMVRLLAVTWARVEAAIVALEAAEDPEQHAHLERNLRAWIGTCRRLLADLGMSPTARARMGLDVAQTARALNVTDLAAAALVNDEPEAGS